MDSKYVKAYVSMLNQLTEAEGVSRFANTADFYDQGIDGPNGERTTIDTSTGKVKTSNGMGTDVTSVQGTPISHTTPNLGGASVKTYTGSAQGKGMASGGQKTSYDSGPMQATQYKDPAGKQTASNMTYDLGVAKFNASQQGDENSPVTTTASYVQPDGSYGDNSDLVSPNQKLPTGSEQPQTMEEELETLRRLIRHRG